MVESTYRRAIRGRTMEGINSSKIVTQTDFIREPKREKLKRFSLFKPNTWF